MTTLDALRGEIIGRAEAEPDRGFPDRLFVGEVGGLLHVEFFGDPFGDSYPELMEALVDPDVAGRLASLTLRGPDEGANGTRNWDIGALAGSGVDFPGLRSLSIQQTGPADHNRSIVARVYDEDGVLARLLEKAPGLEELVSPSAPSADFFRVGRRPLRSLSVDAGYDHQGFIRNLARSGCFPDLRSLEFGEYNETYMEDFASLVTPFEDYRELFGSSAFAPVGFFRWRNPACSGDEIAGLKAMGRGRHFQVVRWSAEWIR